MAKKGKLIQKNSEVGNQKQSSPEVSFIGFFQDCLHKQLVKPWQEKEIRAFFYQLGLRDKEPSDKYKDALAKY